jgi:large subunit ribosomal protein L33
MREWIFLECGKCGNRYYRTSRNAKATAKIERKKFCSVCRAHTPHKEKRK